MRRQCIEQGCTNVTTATRCTVCQGRANARRNQAKATHYDATWRDLSRRLIRARRAQYGDVCPGWNRDPHPVDIHDWTCDHDVGPLCRSCNSNKGATVDRDRKQGIIRNDE
jgi:5-methylcytosine-specific restriction protein A